MQSGFSITKSILQVAQLTVNLAELQMLRESLANLEYLIEKVAEPEVKQSFIEQRDRSRDRLAELESLQKPATQS